MSQRRLAFAIGAACIALAVLLFLVFQTAHANDPFAGATTKQVRGEAASAIQDYLSFLKEHPDDPLAPVAAMSAAHLQRTAAQNPEAALSTYDRVLQEYEGTTWAAEAARRKGEILEEREEWARAGDAFQQALRLSTRPDVEAPVSVSPNYVAGDADAAPRVAWYNEVALHAADCFYKMGERVRVVQTYQQVLEHDLSPEIRAATLQRLGTCYEEGGDEAQAAEHYAAVIQEYPFSQEFPLAMAKAGLILQHKPMDLAPFEAWNRANALLQRREFEPAAPALDSLLHMEIPPVLHDGVRAIQIIAETVAGGDFAQGRRELERIQPRLARTCFAPRLEQSLDGFVLVTRAEDAAQESPDDPELLHQLGTVYLQAGATERAIQTLEQARDQQPEDPDINVMLGYAYQRAQRPMDAARAFEVYLKQNPNDTRILNLIGYAYLGDEDAENALPYFERYVELAPDDPNAHDSLAEGLMNLGRLEEAAGEYEKAVKINPNFTNSYFMLGTLHSRMDQKEKAIEAFRDFLRLAPNDPRVPQAEAAIEQLEES